MRQTIILLAIFILTIKVSAEKIDGLSNIRREPSGEKFVSLYDKTDVTCTELENDWYQIGFKVKLTKYQYEQQKNIIPSGTRLYNLKNELIGEALIDLIISSVMEGGLPENRWYATEFIGYTYKTNIRPESIPENELKQILIQNKGNLDLSHFDSFLKLFEFDNSGLLGRFDNNYTEYMIYEHWIDDPSPMDRIRLIFKEDNLIAIIHTRDLGVDYLLSEDLIRSRKIAILEDMSDTEKDSFIQMNKESYSE